MAPLQFLAPLVFVDQAFSAGLAALTHLVVLSAFVAPLTWVLLMHPLPTGPWRWAFAWWLLPAASMLVCSEAVRGGANEGGLLALFLPGAWLALVLVVGLPRLAFRAVRFLVTGRSAAPGRFDRALGALGLVAAGLGATAALFAGRLGALGLVALVTALALLAFRAPPAVQPNPRSRLAWLGGTLLMAVATPPLLASAALLAMGHLPGGNGVVLTLASVVGLGVGFLSRWLGGFSSRKLDLNPNT